MSKWVGCVWGYLLGRRYSAGCKGITGGVKKAAPLRSGLLLTAAQRGSLFHFNYNLKRSLGLRARLVI